MIDYEKLNNRVEYLETTIRDLRWRMNAVCNKLSMDEEPAKPEPKYKKGAEVWAAYDEPKKFIVRRQIGSKYDLMEEKGTHWIGLVYESDLFPTRQALIEHQITYWQSLQEDQRDVDQMMYDESKKFWPSEPKPDCQKCHNYRNANNKLGYDCLCEEMKPEITTTGCSTCQGFGDMRLYAGLGKYKRCQDCNPDIQSNQPQVDVDRCQELIPEITPYNRKCPECGSGMADTAGLNRGWWITGCTNKRCDYVDSVQCQHESNGLCYTSNPPQNKCIKCGEFYR